MTTSPITPVTETQLLALAVQSAGFNLTPEAAASMTLAQLELDSLELVSLAMAFDDAHGLYLDLKRVSADSTLLEVVRTLTTHAP